jgi:release factor glutamine methyltransferase
MRLYFGELEFDVPLSVYHPAEDSMLLGEAMVAEKLKGKKLLEVGCGSGVLAIIAAREGADVTAVDIDKAAVAVTMDNAVKCDASIVVKLSDLFSAVEGEKFDLVVFNPPYLPEDLPHYADSRWSGGPDGRATIDRFIDKVDRHLNESGAVLLLVSSLSDIDKVIESFYKSRFVAKVIAKKKVPWEELAVLRAVRLGQAGWQ